ncbi:flagellar assembly T-like protein [Crenobacter luteus]|uniref:flagellar assembly protein T N-terminal domain-containing protein n=1 Tax=Crenobacter luteus TaxID=1452487 RepID=UPI00104CA21B|nr:flagellar assembly protein T N-terminal domain-containing protein [Crenobacter luteus]TCP15731.1 flagellar assembly T-like protein [Crenobacter luteus]
MRRLALAAALSAAFVLPASAERLTGTGYAALDAGPVAAREAAIADALEAAALSRAARVTSAELVEPGRIGASTSLSAAPLPAGRVTVVDEGVRDGLYRVTVAVDTAQPGPRADGGRCPDGRPTGRALKRRVLASYFYLDAPRDASDLGELSRALAAEFARRLSALPRFAARDGGAFGVLPEPAVADPDSGGERAREIGRREDVQFVLAGRVIDTGVGRVAPGFSLFGADRSRPGAFYAGPLSGLFGAGVTLEPAERRFDFELWVYDAFSGALVVRERFAATAEGRVAGRSLPPFASEAFRTTDYGRTVDALLGEAVGRVDALLACVPFMSRVARVEDGRRLYLGDGALAGLKVGDSLLVYKQRPQQALRAAASERRLGVAERLSGDAVVIQVQPGLAVARLQNARYPVAAGDLVRLVTPAP